MTSESLRSISRMEKLEVLTMTGCSLVDDVGMQYIGNGCPSLQVLAFLKFFPRRLIFVDHTVNTYTV